MYNRYIPAPDGTYKKHSVSDPPCPPTPPPEPPKFHKPSGSGNIGHFLGNLLPAGLDTEDLIVVLLLLLISRGLQRRQQYGPDHHAYLSVFMRTQTLPHGSIF